MPRLAHWAARIPTPWDSLPTCVFLDSNGAKNVLDYLECSPQLEGCWRGRLAGLVGNPTERVRASLVNSTRGPAYPLAVYVLLVKLEQETQTAFAL
jgi:hypothetical protein